MRVLPVIWIKKKDPTTESISKVKLVPKMKMLELR